MFAMFGCGAGGLEWGGGGALLRWAPVPSAQRCAPPPPQAQVRAPARPPRQVCHSSVSLGAQTAGLNEIHAPTFRLQLSTCHPFSIRAMASGSEIPAQSWAHARRPQSTAVQRFGGGGEGAGHWPWHLWVGSDLSAPPLAPAAVSPATGMAVPTPRPSDRRLCCALSGSEDGSASPTPPMPRAAGRFRGVSVPRPLVRFWGVPLCVGALRPL